MDHKNYIRHTHISNYRERKTEEHYTFNWWRNNNSHSSAVACNNITMKWVDGGIKKLTACIWKRFKLQIEFIASPSIMFHQKWSLSCYAYMKFNWVKGSEKDHITMDGERPKAKKSIKAIKHFEFNYFMCWWRFPLTSPPPPPHPRFNFENIFYWLAIIIARKIDGHLTKLLVSKLISLSLSLFFRLLLMVSIDDDGREGRSSSIIIMAFATSQRRSWLSDLHLAIFMCRENWSQWSEERWKIEACET